MRRASAAAAVAAVAALGLAACGGSSSSNDTTAAATPPATTATTGGGGGGAASTVNISTGSGTDLAYQQKSVTANAGSVTVDFQNNESIPHDVAVEDSSGKTLGQTDLVASGSSNTTVNVTPGTYTFFCTVPGHRQAGMEGTLTVK